MKTFEDLPVWQAARQLVKDIYSVTSVLPFSRDSGLRDQIQRAAVSVPSNIAEGHERGSTPDLIQFLFYAKGSAGEVRSQLYNAEDLGYLSHEKAEALRQSCRDIGRQLSAWIQSMQGPGVAGGPKFHREPDHRMERFWKKVGMERGPDGRMRKIEAEEKPTANGTGRTEDGTREER